ncbi:MAG: hypothetical protein L3K14_00110 [Thermoplasmata archaeon]|nr:hypothetical protein [Thermoplasmata archaeon]
MNDQIGRLIRRLKEPLPLFILVNIPLLFAFYDAWNLSTILYASSYLSIGLNPYHYHNEIPGGLPIQALGLVAYYGFQAFHWNYVAAAALLKVVFMVLTYLSGLTLSRVAKLEGLEYHRKILYAFVLNPFILFVNDVWVETDVIIIFLYLLGYVSLYYGWQKGGELRYLVLGALLLSLAFLSYYSVVLLLPTLILYRATNRQKIQTLLAFLGMGGLLSIPVILFKLSSVGTLAAGLQAPGTGVSPYSAFNLLAPFSGDALGVIERASLIIVLVSSVIIPIALKKYGVKEPGSLLVTYSAAFLFFVNTVPSDNLVLLVGLLLLALISLRRASLSYRQIFVLQLFLLPQFIIAEMLNGAGGATGVFYWSYSLFHAAPNVFRLLGDGPVWKALILAYLVSFSLTVRYFLIANQPGRPVSVEAPPVPLTPISARRPSGRRSQAVSAVLLVTILLLGALIPSALAADPRIGATSASVVGFNPGLFVPLEYTNECAGLPECAYPLSAPGSYQVSTSQPVVSFASTAVPIGLYRNLTNQSFMINLTASAQWGAGIQAPSLLDVVNGSAFYAGLGNVMAVNNSSAVIPSNSSVYTSVALGSTPLFSVPSEIFQLNGTGGLSYGLTPAALPGHELLFGTKLDNSSAKTTALWDVNVGKVAYDAFILGNRFVLGNSSSPNGPWHFETTQFRSPANRWLVTGFEVTANGTNLTGFVNGLTLTEPWNMTAASTAQLIVGKSGIFSNAFPPSPSSSIVGNVTNLYSAPINGSLFAQTAYVWTALSGTLSTFGSNGTVAVALSGTSELATLRVGPRVMPVGPLHDLWIGKLSDAPNSLTVAFGSLRISPHSSEPNLELIVVDFAVLIPLVLSVWCLYPLLERRLSSKHTASR